MNTSIQTCKSGVPQYTILQLLTRCSRCHFITRTFTSKILSVSFNITRLYICRFSNFSSTFSNHLHCTAGGLNNVLRLSCRYVILPGRSSPVNSTNMEYAICGQDMTCFETGSNVGPGCYCEEGYRLNKTTGLCVPLSSCPPMDDDVLSECNNEPVCYLIYYYHCQSKMSFQFIIILLLILIFYL